MVKYKVLAMTSFFTVALPVAEAFGRSSWGF